MNDFASAGFNPIILSPLYAILLRSARKHFAAGDKSNGWCETVALVMSFAYLMGLTIMYQEKTCHGLLPDLAALLPLAADLLRIRFGWVFKKRVADQINHGDNI